MGEKGWVQRRSHFCAGIYCADVEWRALQLPYLCQVSKTGCFWFVCFFVFPRGSHRLGLEGRLSQSSEEYSGGKGDTIREGNQLLKSSQLPSTSCQQTGKFVLFCFQVRLIASFWKIKWARWLGSGQPQMREETVKVMLATKESLQLSDYHPSHQKEQKWEKHNKGSTLVL